MGRPALSADEKILRGTFEIDKSHEHERPRLPDAESLPCPEDLGGVARELWEQVVPDLIAANIAKECDIPALTMMCKWHAIHHQLMEKLLAGEADDRTHMQAKTAASIYGRLLEHFGLTPVNRSRLHVVKKPDKKPVATRKREGTSGETVD